MLARRVRLLRQHFERTFSSRARSAVAVRTRLVNSAESARVTILVQAIEGETGATKLAEL
jgi:hypothetical protein